MSSPTDDRVPPQPLGDLPALYKVDRAARWLGVAEKTIRRLIAAGDLAVVRIGRQIRISERELARFFERKSDPPL